MIKVKDNLVGKKYGRLTVIKQAEDYITPSTQKHKAMWECLCECGNTVIVDSWDLKRKTHATQSCGCLNKENTAKRWSELFHKTNHYEFCDDYVIGYTSNTNEPFYFDADDYDLVKDICWGAKTNKFGFKQLYGYNRATKKSVLFHNHIGFRHYDHIDRNELNNRKSNLRPCSTTENARNKSKYKNNTTGVTGVCWHKKNKKWVASIRINHHQTYLGSFQNKQDAIITRLKAEIQYFGEFAPNRELYEKYNLLSE